MLERVRGIILPCIKCYVTAACGVNGSSPKCSSQINKVNYSNKPQVRPEFLSCKVVRLRITSGIAFLPSFAHTRGGSSTQGFGVSLSRWQLSAPRQLFATIKRVYSGIGRGVGRQSLCILSYLPPCPHSVVLIPLVVVWLEEGDALAQS